MRNDACNFFCKFWSIFILHIPLISVPHSPLSDGAGCDSLPESLTHKVHSIDVFTFAPRTCPYTWSHLFWLTKSTIQLNPSHLDLIINELRRMAYPAPWSISKSKKLTARQIEFRHGLLSNITCFDIFRKSISIVKLWTITKNRCTVYG